MPKESIKDEKYKGTNTHDEDRVKGGKIDRNDKSKYTIRVIFVVVFLFVF